MAGIRLVPNWRGKITEAAQPLLDSVLHDIAEDARRAAPVATGYLRSSIHVDGNAVVADADYASFVEYGTSHMNARPFMRPSLYKKRF